MIINGKVETIDDFIAMVDRVIQRKTGVSVHDLPDFAFSDFYEENMDYEDAKEAARDCAAEMLADEDYDCE